MPMAQSIVVPNYKGQANIRPSLAGVIRFSSGLLRLMSLAGVILPRFSLPLGAWYFLEKLIGTEHAPGRPTTVPVVTSHSGRQPLFALGLIGEYAGRSYDEVRKRPTPIVDRKIIFHRPE